MTAYPNPPGPPPKPEAQRRRYGKPKSYGAADPTTAPAAAPADRELGIDGAHPLVVAMWDAVQESCEAGFYSAADWERLRWELWYANALFTGRRQLTPVAWSAVQSGLGEMLISPAVKRRAGIDVKPQGAVDADAVAAAEQLAQYRQVLKSV
jgi:hypothetical protein